MPRIPLRLAPLALFALLSACGGAKPPPPSTAAAASPPPTGSAAIPSKPPAELPPPFRIGSTKASTRNDARYATCVRDYRSAGKDPASEVSALARACTGPTSLHAAGDVLKGEQADNATPQAFPLRVEASKCYRVYAAAEPSVKAFSVVLKDGAGEIAASENIEGGPSALTSGGVICFKESDNAQVVVSVGMGKGKYALQVWSD